MNVRFSRCLWGAGLLAAFFSQQAASIAAQPTSQSICLAGNASSSVMVAEYDYSYPWEEDPRSPQSNADETGLTALIARLGAGNQPTGANVEVGQVEGDDGTGWAPNPSTPGFLGKTFTMVSPNPVYSTHATGVGQYFYGNTTSISPGITQIDCYELVHWAYDGFLKYPGTAPPATVTLDIFNNSWISASSSGASGSNLLLRKSDYAVSAQGLIFANGVNNGTGPLDYPLLSHMFNGIAVGRNTGQHHAGDTGLGVDGPGRMKPDIVAPGNYTSQSTPLVAGAAALMMQTARTHPSLINDPNAQRPEVIRAVLMAGAAHRTGWTNNAVLSGPNRGTTTQPLDALYGADELDVNHAHFILTGGEQLPATAPAQTVYAPHAGWALVDIPTGASRWWRFHVGSTKPYVSILAVWHRRVADDFASYTIPNADLELWRIDPVNGQTTLVGEPGLPYFTGGNVRSTSPDDNVEHLYFSGLQPGDYLLELRRAADGLPSWDVAVAWELACQTFPGCACEAIPATPAATGASASASNRITVHWNDSPSAATARYFVSRATGAGGPYSRIATIDDASPAVAGSGTYSYDDTTVSGGTTYFYVIDADDGASCTSAHSNEVSALATGTCFRLPTFAGLASVTAPALANCTLTLSWAAGSSNCGSSVTYSVYRSTSAGFVPSDRANRIVNGLLTTTYSDTGVSAGTTYYYVVRAIDAASGGSEGNSVERSAVPSSSCSVAPTPGDVTPLGWNGETELAWPPTENATTYKVYRGLFSDLPGLLDGTTDSCARFSGSSLSCVIDDDPSGVEGGLLWYLVTGVGGAEGSAGRATTGERVVNSPGACP